MEPQCVDFHLNETSSHFWFVARRKFLQARVARYLSPADTLLDIGCGDGGKLDWMRDLVGSAQGIEPDPEVCAAARRKGHAVINDRFPAPLALTSTAVTLFDVLEHLPDDREAVQAVGRLAAPGARLFLTVPGHAFLWSKHDRRNHRYRRYTKGTPADVLRANGFDIVSREWFGAAALVAVMLLRVAGRDQMGLIRPGPVLPHSALTIYAIERRFRVPFGLSLFVMAQKRGGRAGA